MNIQDLIKDNKLSINAKPNSKTTQIIGVDETGLVKVEVKAPPENNKANIEIIKFFSKLSKSKVTIVSGFTSRKKVLKFG